MRWMDYDDLRVARVLVATAHELPVPVVLMEDTQDRMILFRNSAAGKAAPGKPHVHRYYMPPVSIPRSLTEFRTFKKPKSDKTRWVLLDDELAAVLQEHRMAQDEEKRAIGSAYVDQDLVFARADGSALDPAWFGDAAQRCIDRAGVTRITLHDLRRTLATLALEGGADVHLISRQLGHSDVRTTERYLYIRPTRNAEVSAAFRRMRRSGNPSSGRDLAEAEVGEAETPIK